MEIEIHLPNEIEYISQTFGVGQRSIDDPFFQQTHKVCKIFQRKGVTVEDDEELCHELLGEIPCNACSATFTNLVDFELHYHDEHRYICAQCKKWRPTARLLEIHVEENHDSFFQVQAQRQPMYQCFASECQIKFSNPQERREHCVFVHKFPKFYRFDETRMKTKDFYKNCFGKISKMDMDTSEIEKKEPKLHLETTKQVTFSKRNVSVIPKKVISASGNLDYKKSSISMFIPRQIQQKSRADTSKNSSILNNMMKLADSLPEA